MVDAPSELEDMTEPMADVTNSSTDGATTTTWNFVQMNMSLLPIARPLPVTTVCHRFQESFQSGRKPRTPNQKLHRRVLQNASNISPRRHDLGMRRTSISTNHSSHSSTASSAAFAASARSQPSSPLLRIQLPNASSSPAQSPHSSPASFSSATQRIYSQSDDTLVQCIGNKRGRDGYASDSSDSQLLPVHGELQLSRSVSLSTAWELKTYKGKRIMELLDEERRLHPDEHITAGAQSPTKRSRLH
uniref:Uncharacterized protein n=1 Tax=Globisporangium ultimum (strain ATCC 200006 / CBS 805.95 / DAOM BR144) TaxID=431595 RepID=K3XAZ6_GLOUD